LLNPCYFSKRKVVKHVAVQGELITHPFLLSRKVKPRTLKEAGRVVVVVVVVV